MRSRATALATALGVVLAAAGCGGGQETPRDTFERLRAALTAQSGTDLDALTDANGRFHRRAEIREHRAMLERGDDEIAAMDGMPLSAQELRSSTDDVAAGLLLERRSPLFASAEWLAKAAVVEEVDDGPDCAVLRLKGADDVRRELWFVRESGRWCYDQFRSRQNW